LIFDFVVQNFQVGGTLVSESAKIPKVPRGFRQYAQ
jgi:hypothetical protein